jgi:glycosyltransferase involved in cell wall biosynthesis
MDFSVIIPFYNTPVKTLEKACSSVVSSFLNHVNLNITYSSHELKIILVNDGSIICYNDFLDSFKRNVNFDFISISYFRNEINLGRSYSRNLGLKISNSQFVSFLDSDDVYMINFFSTFFETYSINPNFDFYTFSYKLNNFFVFRINFRSLFRYSNWKYFNTNSFVLDHNKCNTFFYDEDLSKGEDIKYFFNLIRFKKGLHTNIVVSIYYYDYKSYHCRFKFKFLKILFYFFKFTIPYFIYKEKNYSIVS